MMRTQKTIKIIGTVGIQEEASLLCEIPRNLARNFKINAQGFIDGDLELDALDLIKLIRRAYIQDLNLERSKNNSQKSTHELSQNLKQELEKNLAQNLEKKQRLDFLYAMIFDTDLAVSPNQNNFPNNPNHQRGAESWN